MFYSHQHIYHNRDALVKWVRDTLGCAKLDFYCRTSRRRQWHPTPVVLPGKSHGWRSLVGCSPWVVKSWTRLSDFTFTFHFHALEKEMATHSSVLACRIPGTAEPGGLPSMGSHRVGHDWSDLAAAAAAAGLLRTATMHYNSPRRLSSPTFLLRIPVFLGACCATLNWVIQ